MNFWFWPVLAYVGMAAAWGWLIHGAPLLPDDGKIKCTDDE